MQFEYNWKNRIVAFFDSEPHRRFRCINTDCPGPRDLLIPDRFLAHARLNGCDWCGDTLCRHDQRTCVACPGCPAELIRQPENVEQNDVQAGLVRFTCQNCGTVSECDFAAPAPLLLDRPDDTENEQ